MGVLCDKKVPLKIKGKFYLTTVSDVAWGVGRNNVIMREESVKQRRECYDGCAEILGEIRLGMIALVLELE